MIRIWNFNRNRVHADRGVRNIVIEIDQKVLDRFFFLIDFLIIKLMSMKFLALFCR